MLRFEESIVLTIVRSPIQNYQTILYRALGLKGKMPLVVSFEDRFERHSASHTLSFFQCLRPEAR